MNRRDFIVGTGAGLGAVWPGSKTWTESGVTAGTAGIFIGDQAKTTSEHSYPAERIYHLLGVPLRTGSLYPGNENDSQAYRDAQLLGLMRLELDADLIAKLRSVRYYGGLPLDARTVTDDIVKQEGK